MDQEGLILREIASIHRRIDDKFRVDDQRHEEVLDRFDRSDRRIERLENLDRPDKVRKDIAFYVWLFFGGIGGTIALLRLIGKI